MSLVVIGTDTEIGKTIACAVLLNRCPDPVRPAYWKPIATGSSEGRDTSEIQRLLGDRVQVWEECYLFEPPVSPHLAAREAGVTIQPERIVAEFSDHPKQGPLLIEGIGGLLVPLTMKGYLLADLLEELDLPCLLVTSTRLGTINHTLLTLEAAARRRLKLAGVLLNGPANEENRQAIERFGGADIVGRIAPLEPVSPQTVADASGQIDPEGKLNSYLETT